MQSVVVTRQTGVLIGLLGAVAAAQPLDMQPERQRDCAVCHIAWLDVFTERRGTLLIERPTEASVSEQQTCLGCHDGSVADSRRRVWLEHGHATGVEPPPSMQVPEVLPLKDGKIDCRTCHIAHSGGGSETLAATVFLRVRNDASQLCRMCHPEKARGPELGTHPVGGMPWPVPEELIASGARVGPDKQRLICQTCHTPHGAREDHLLVMATQSSQLCLTCHAKLRPRMWQMPLMREHPQNPPLTTDAQRQAIRQMGTKTGPGETLICLSCHKLHHGQAGRAMLADTLHDSRLCLRCHPQRKGMFGSVHDLRTSAPEERNRLGQKPQQSGPCGVCHSFHQFARRPDPKPADPTGLCTSCHQPGEPGEKFTGVPFSHPVEVPQSKLPAETKLEIFASTRDKSKRMLACLTCHDPHEAQRPHFLRADPDTLCAECHPDKAATLAGAHDFTNRPELKNGQGRTATQTGKCGFCHAVHSAGGPVLWIATKAAPKNADDLCVQCHQAGGLAVTLPAGKFLHPTGEGAKMVGGTGDNAVPLFDTTLRRAEDGFVACASCHDPHGDSTKSTSLLRDNKPASSLCITCHLQQASARGGVQPRAVPKHWPAGAEQKNADLCAACHKAHGDRLRGDVASLASMPAFASSSELCTTCHRNEPFMKRKYLHGPVAAGMCIACHDTHSVRKGEKTIEQGRQLCLSCHEEVERQIAAARHVHPPVQDDCGACHDPHGSDQKMQVRGSKSRLCVGCHKTLAKLIEGSEYVHGAIRTEDGCGNCHNSHVSMLPRLLKDTQLHTCLSCHNKQIELADGKKLADMASLLRENPEHHGPIRRADCTACHNPHASDNFRLLSKEYPEFFYAPFDLDNYDLCFECHMRDMVLVKQGTGLTRFQNGDLNLHFVHVNKQSKGRTCRACHEVHASKNPAHIREKVPFGMGNWQFDLHFEMTATGGKCAPACHKPMEYVRPAKEAAPKPTAKILRLPGKLSKAAPDSTKEVKEVRR